MKFNKPAMCRLCQTIAVNPYRTGVFPVPDVVSVRTLDWASSGVKDFEDAFSSNGYFVGAQNLATNGLDYQSWAIEAIGDEMPDLPQHEALDADVRVAYFYTEPFMWTNVDFRTFGS